LPPSGEAAFHFLRTDGAAAVLREQAGLAPRRRRSAWRRFTRTNTAGIRVAPLTRVDRTAAVVSAQCRAVACRAVKAAGEVVSKIWIDASTRWR
jgi:hypothetical protein